MPKSYTISSRLTSSRGAAAVGLLLALGLLAACETKSGTQQPATNSSDVAIATSPESISGSRAFWDELRGAGDRVFFAVDRSDLSPDAEATLRNQAMLLAAYPLVTVTIEGHADERGTREYNLALADRRADAVRNYLTALGVAPERIETVSYGKERPDCADASDSCWATNRRGVTAVDQ